MPRPGHGVTFIPGYNAGEAVLTKARLKTVRAVTSAASGHGGRLDAHHTPPRIQRERPPASEKCENNTSLGS